MQTHLLDERYGNGTKTVCCLDVTPRRLRSGKMAVTTDTASADCLLCEQVRQKREQMDREVATGTFWKRFA
jgi:hypothetical protein